MAIKPKKKSTSLKKTSKRKKVSKNKSIVKKNILIFLTVLLALAFISFGYLLDKGERENLPIGKNGIAYSTQDLLNDLAQLKTQKPTEDTRLKTTEKLKNEKQISQIQVKEKLSKNKKIPKKEIQQIPFKERGAKREKKNNAALVYRGSKPRLAIIIDDVHSKAQIYAIKKLGMKITPSIFPPYILSPKSHLLARQVKHSMIHLPMESGSKQFNKQTKTLMTSFSDERIADRVMEIRRLFPHTKYVNNHTGSVFTSDYKAMKKLYIALKMEGFTFVDSFTVASSKVQKIAHEYGDIYLKRDIFIDNIHTIASIHKQLKLAVKKAKKNGYAIAIGHPHEVTMKALDSAKKILKDVELVYIDDLYRRK